MEKNMETDYKKVFIVIFPCSMMYLDRAWDTRMDCKM